MNKYLRTFLLFVTLLVAPAAAFADADELTAMLHEFLANAHKASAHEKFFAEDLVYTSSSGMRFGKADIMQSFEGVEDSDEPPAVIYAAEDIDVRLYDDMAIVAFRLVGAAANGPRKLDYFNTGTFLKRDGEWRVVAWQATKIPAAVD